MCSNRAIVDSLECYMDDLVETFEDFVKKSLIVISLGIGVIVAMLVYLLKVVSEKQPTQNIITDNAILQNTTKAQKEIQNLVLEEDTTHKGLYIPAKETKVQVKNCAVEAYKDKDILFGNVTPKPLSMPSYDEQILRDIGLTSCSKTTCEVRGDRQNNIISRVPIPFQPSKYKSIHSLRSSKHNLSASQLYSRTLEKQSSCCSMCCNNKPSAKERKL